MPLIFFFHFHFFLFLSHPKASDDDAYDAHDGDDVCLVGRKEGEVGVHSSIAL